MRIISFSQKWDKLKQGIFTTFRYPRADKDWYIGEKVQVYYKNRSPNREKLGIAEIVSKTSRHLDTLTHDEAVKDGFKSTIGMITYIRNQYKDRYVPVMNKITLRWIHRE